MILVVDNHDSFVFNLARTVEELGRKVRVMRHDAVDPEMVAALSPEAVILSPGPCGPAEATGSMAVLRAFWRRLPILGVCLGHQCAGAFFGGRVTRAREPMHGRASAIHHDGCGLFAGLPNPFPAARYHSLIVELDESSPLRVTARSTSGEIMAVAHPDAPVFGVQFHPESILTPQGHALVGRFLDIARDAG